MARGKYKARAENKRIEELEAEVEGLNESIKDVTAQLKAEKEAHELTRRNHSTIVNEALRQQHFTNPVSINGIRVEALDLSMIMQGIRGRVTECLISAAKKSQLSIADGKSLSKNFAETYSRMIRDFEINTALWTPTKGTYVRTPAESEGPTTGVFRTLENGRYE